MAFQYQDIRAMMGSLFNTLASAAKMINRPGMPGSQPAGAPGDEAAMGLLVDPSAQPDAATLAKYWSHSWGYATKESTGIHGASQIVYPK